MTQDSLPEGERTFRSPSGLVTMIASVLLAVFLLGDAVLRAGWEQMMLLAPWVLLGLWIVYEFTYASFVRVDEAGVTVQNMLRRTTFGWNRVRDIDLLWQLEFTLDDDKMLTAMGGPSRVRAGHSHSRVRGDTAARVPAGLRDLTEIRDRWEASNRGAGSVSSDAPIRRVWDMPALFAIAIIAVWAIAAVTITQS